MDAFAQAALLGLFVGDAAGATLEFFPRRIEPSDVDNALRMNGGGVLNVGPGQITDDGELAICLLDGLCGHQPQQDPPLDRIASQYVDWLLSSPFDIGNTCRNSFTAGRQYCASHGSSGLADHMMQASRSYNATSQANGALMRVVPIVIWSASGYLPAETVARNCALDALLSHPHKICQDCNAVYGVAMAHLLAHHGDAAGALQQASSYAQQHADPTVRQWLEDSQQDRESFACGQNMGHVKHAFMLTFHHLRLGSSFKDAIWHTLMQGGDTDTNAAIVGGMMGALHGDGSSSEKGIPSFMKTPVLDFDCTKMYGEMGQMGHVRDTRWSAASAMERLHKQLNACWKHS